MTSCSIIVPTHRQLSLTRQCLEATVADFDGEGGPEILLTGDAALDSVVEIVTARGLRCRVLHSGKSQGFAARCNKGAESASGRYLIFLRDDTVPRPGWFQALLRHAEEHSEGGPVGAKLLFPDDTVQHAGIVFSQDGAPRHLYAGFSADHPAVNKSRPFQAVSAACLMVRRQLFDQVGGFDVDFHGDLAGIDLCLRLGKQGHQTYFCHEATLYRLESQPDRVDELDEADERLYRQRWAHRVRPDELQYYFEDELISVNYNGSYPLELSVSPLVASVDRDEMDREAYRLLAMRSRQVHELLKEIVRLTARVREAVVPAAPEMQGSSEVATKDASGDESAFPGGTSTEPRQTIGDETAADLDELQELWKNAQKQLVRREQEIQSAIFDLQNALAKSLADPSLFQASSGTQAFLPSRYLGYEQLIQRTHLVVRTALPPDATVLVVGKGDDQLVQIEGLNGWHFPRGEDGRFGHYPADSEEAIAHLEALRVEGAEFILFPTTSYWWLEHYANFGRHLETHYQEIVRQEDTCRIYALRVPRADTTASAKSGDAAQRTRQIRDVVCAVLPENTIVAVVSEGDSDLLQLGKRTAWHFPQAESAGHAGNFPRDSQAAIAELDALLEKGAQFLLLPSSAFWWLEHYREFKQYLERCFPLVVRQEYLCLIYGLAENEVDGKRSQEH